jgi:hypothetical protein
VSDETPVKRTVGCFFGFHAWGRWKERKMKAYIYHVMQVRHCVTCGRAQAELLHNGHDESTESVVD